MNNLVKKMNDVMMDENGRIGPPLLLWFLGVPGGVCLLLWFFIWRGHA